MISILNAAQMSAVDKITQEKFYIPSLVLMERAALACTGILGSEFDISNTLIVCGVGNNGGDGLAIARILYEKGIRAEIYIVGDVERATESFKNQMSSLKALGFTFEESLIDKNYTCIVDAVFGISLNRDVAGVYADAISFINNASTAGAGVLSVDMPSGISADSGRVMGLAVKAEVTVTFGFMKTGLLLYPGADYAGKVILENIGMPKESLSELKNTPAKRSKIKCYEEDEIKLPQRPAYSNKGTFGKLLLVAGSEGMRGACILSGLSAMRSGLGMLKIVTPNVNAPTVASVFPEAMMIEYVGGFVPYGEIAEAMKWCDAIAIGPGIGKGDASLEILRMCMEQSSVPVVADADALNLMAEHPEILENHACELVITPHVGEMSRLCGLGISDITGYLIETASDFAAGYNLVCVLKDARTITADTNGNVVINNYGNSGMATAGSGDVLTGIIAALLAGGMVPFKAASLGCALHAKSGDRAAAELSEAEVLSRDIIKYIGL